MAMRILLANRNEILRKALRRALETQRDTEIVGEAIDERSVAKLVVQLRPEVVIMDMAMRDLSGLAPIRRVLRTSPEVKLVALCAGGDGQGDDPKGEGGDACTGRGANALVEFVSAVKAMAGGRARGKPSVPGGFIGKRSRNPGQSGAALTKRESEVLQLVANGYTTRQIAAQFGRSVKTIEAHRHHIARRLQIRSIAGLTRYAIREGLAQLSP